VGAFNVSQSTKVHVSGIENVGGTPVYDLTAKDQYGNPIQDYQFRVSLEQLNDTHTIDEVVTVQINSLASTQYTLQRTSGTPVLVPITEIEGVLTDSQGMVRVTLQYFGNGVTGVDYNLADYAAPLWFDDLGTPIFN
jgi:hypothetical protein